MDPASILIYAFVVSFVALMVFIWSQRGGLFDRSDAGAEVIFAPGEIGRIEEPAGTANSQQALQGAVDAAGTGTSAHGDPHEIAERAEADASTGPLIFFFYCCSIVWLLVASLAGLTASIKLHDPDWLTSQQWLTFGIIRTIHLNSVAYGWTPMAGLGTVLFVIPRVLKTPLIGMRYAFLGAILWNTGLVAGLGAIATGFNAGLMWLEMPWQVSILMAVGGALIGLPLVLTLVNRRVEHLYVSVWYMGAALFWFPVLFITAKIPTLYTGIGAATMNWWFGHNVLGLFYTPLALASIYYFLPKIIGRPIRSYNLSLLGFWALAFFYGQVGGHHLIGGPVPQWMITLSIVQSMMMIIPVAAFSVNMYQTLEGQLATFRYSPTLRFIGVGGLMYAASSLQGSIEALRSVNRITHFTHFTVAHAHLGLYGFVTLVFFGAMYFVMPRITAREWPYPRLISAHFWLVSIGFAIYFVALTIGGWLQGEAMLDATRPFMDSVALTIPYLEARSVGGALMGLGHLIFAIHFVAMVLNFGPTRDEPALFSHLYAKKVAQ